MTRYVLGFAFNEAKDRVVLIHKNRGPAEIIGKFNGIGGKIETGETTYEAMAREFHEETGVLIPEFLWRRKGRFHGPDWSVEVFTTTTDDIMFASTQEDEAVVVASVAALTGLPVHLCQHVPLLINICLNPSIKNFTWEE